jgi:hypothetical protein
MLDDSKLFDIMDRVRDTLFLDKGYLGYDKRHPEYSFCLPPNTSANTYKKASQKEKKKLDDYDACHKRLALGNVERWNRKLRRWHILSTHTQFRHAATLFPRVLQDCTAFRNIRHQE